MEFLIIENNPVSAKKYDEIGIERIFIDLEILGKNERQGHLDTVISSHHKIEDVCLVKKVLNKSKLLVRVNPINSNSKTEINTIIDSGADIIMLPFFTTVKEVEIFLNIVNKRVKTNLLFETPQSLVRIQDILELEGIDEIHIGLNDLHLGMGLKFMFELISSGIVDYMVDHIKTKNIPFGIGGIASLNSGLVSGKDVLAQHVRLGSSKVILSRSFIKNFNFDFEDIFTEVQLIRELEMKYQSLNHKSLKEICTNFNDNVRKIVNS